MGPSGMGRGGGLLKQHLQGECSVVECWKRKFGGWMGHCCVMKLCQVMPVKVSKASADESDDPEPR